jgi:LPXTG-motif cell wall-anchored protein
MVITPTSSAPVATVASAMVTTTAPTTTAAPKAIAEVTTTVETAVVVATTLAPVVEEKAKTAIVTATATEVQLPSANVAVSINLEEVYTGFRIAASDVKAVEYQVSDGSWTAVTAGTSVKIPKTASKLSIRVTKTNGEKVVSEKAIVRTEASTDTTGPVTTAVPVSSDSSSSNNTLWYILGIVILAGIFFFFFKKKKSDSTK